MRALPEPLQDNTDVVLVEGVIREVLRDDTIEPRETFAVALRPRLYL